MRVVVGGKRILRLTYSVLLSLPNPLPLAYAECINLVGQYHSSAPYMIELEWAAELRESIQKLSYEFNFSF